MISLCKVFEDANLGRGESAGKMGMWVGVGLSQAASGDWWLSLPGDETKEVTAEQGPSLCGL